MSDDLSALREAWTDDQDLEAEVEKSRGLWRRAVRRMWFWNFIEGTVLLLVALQLAISIFGNASWASGLLAVLIVGILLWSLRRRYLLRNAELGSPDAERLSVLEGEVRGVRARLIRNGLALALIIPLFGLGVLFGRIQKSAEVSQPELERAEPAWLASPAVKWLAVVLLLLVVAKLIQVVLRDRRALVQLASRREEYRAEYERDTEGA